MRPGRVLRYLAERRSRGRLHFTLIDPDKADAGRAARIAGIAADAGSDAILVGGSLGVTEPMLGDVVEAARESSGLPVILFPGNLNGLTPRADAVLFMTLLNSDDPYYLSGVQVQAAPIIARMQIEVIPTGYIIVGHGGAAGFVGRARPIPYTHPELVAAHALAAAYKGSLVVYLEAGSGAPRPVPPEAVALAKTSLARAGADDVILVVGGGVRSPEAARALAKAGADALVTGTVAEESPVLLKEIVRSFKEPGGH